MEIAVISGKGGTGKSSISAALATLCSPAVLADCDVDAANLHLIFNPSIEDDQVYISGHKAVIDYDLCSGCLICAGQCRFEAISTHNELVTINEISCEGCFLCSRICPENAIKMSPNDKSRLFSGSFRHGKMAYGLLAPGEENSGKLVNMVRQRARQLSDQTNFETTIIDGPPGIGCPAISTITGVDKIIVVTEPTISGLLDLERTVTMVVQSDRKPYVIINKSDLNLSMTAKISDWCRNNDIILAGTLPFDKKITESMVMGKTIIEYDPDGIISQVLRSILTYIINEK